MDVTEDDVGGIPPGNVRVSRDDFVALWRAASKAEVAQSDRRVDDWYIAAVALTCRWMATAPSRLQNGLGSLVRSPATRRPRVAFEELIEAEYQAAQALEQRRPELARSRPGWCDGVRDTLRWAWRGEGDPPRVLSDQIAGR